MATQSNPATDLEAYTKQALDWLDDHAERRGPAHQVKWGEGSDDVALFKNLSFEEEREHIEALRDWQRQKSDGGYGSIAWPQEYGGSGLDGRYERAFAKLESGYITPIGHEAVSITMELVAPTIRVYGTDAQKDRFVRPMRRGDEMWCQLFSEPGAGSDLASVSTMAQRDGDQWILNGQKVWTSGAQYADFGYIMCRTDPSVAKHRGLTAFVLPMDTPGVDVRPLRQMSGGSSFNEVFLTDVRLPATAQLGEVGAGWSVALTTLGFERAAVTKSGNGGDDLFERLVLLARHVDRQTDPIVRQRLAAIYTEGRLRSLTRRRVSDSIKAGATPGPEGSVGKLAWTQGLRSMADLAGDLLGPRLAADSGEWGTFAWTEFVNGVPGYRVAGGSDEIQRNIIAERVLGLPREARPAG
jgi:alkylation response protein AidB-like acyl-CoA dehydrogenase